VEGGKGQGWARKRGRAKERKPKREKKRPFFNSKGFVLFLQNIFKPKFAS